MKKNKTDYPHNISAAPDYGIVNIFIPAGKTLKAEASSMAYMDSSLKMKARLGGGLNRILSGENLFINEYTAETKDAEIGIAPGTPGDIKHYYLEEESIFIQNSSYLASSNSLDVSTKFQGLNGFFSGEKMFMIKVTGTGDLWFNTFGGIIEIDVKKDYVVDTGYIVGFTEGLTYDIKPVGGLKSTVLSGEGLVCKFTGEGKVWIQTRLTPSFVQWADAYRKVEIKNNN